MEKLSAKISELERRIAALPQGSITVKKIKGRDYYYHRVIKNGNRTETYIPFDQVDGMRTQIGERKVLETMLKKLRKQVPATTHDTSVDPAVFHTIVRMGDVLRAQIAVVRKYKKRECIKKLRDYIFGDYIDRLKERQKQTKPLLDAFFAWAKSLRNIAPKSKLGKAVNYLIEEEPYLRRYIEDGRLEIDNNCAERSIKPFVIGRKNWLFANTPSGAKASATAFSIIETAKENGLDPHEYLKYVFTKAPNLKDNESIDILLPWNAPVDCHTKAALSTE